MVSGSLLWIADHCRTCHYRNHQLSDHPLCYAKDTALEIMAVNAIQSEDNPAGDSGYYNGFLKENGLDPDKSEVLVSSNLGASANENDGASAESIQMIQSRFMTQSVDVFLRIMISFIHWESLTIWQTSGNICQKNCWKNIRTIWCM